MGLGQLVPWAAPPALLERAQAVERQLCAAEARARQSVCWSDRNPLFLF